MQRHVAGRFFEGTIFMHLTKFIPRILLCGDEADFFARVADRPYRIVGRVELSGTVDGQSFDITADGKVCLNDKVQDFGALKEFLLGGEVDYLVFTTRKLFFTYHAVAVKNGLINLKAVTLEQFNVMPREIFYDPNIPLRLLEWTKLLAVKTLLDFDGFFATMEIFNKPANDLTQIDAVTEKTLPPIAENIYRRVYKSLAEVGLQKYDAVFLAERDPQDFDAAFTLTENMSDVVLTYGRTGSALEKYLHDNPKMFADGKGLRLPNGNLFYLERRRPPESFCIYVVTYKNIKLDEPPAGYKIIQAGRAVNAHTGYPGDDTGDNISNLNVYLNELTALYWFWKNTSETIVGLCHYRRFFTLGDEKFDRDKILTQADALKILETHDIIVSRPFYGVMNQHEFIEHDCGERLTKLCDVIFRKHLLRVHPDYVDTFDFVLKSKAVYRSHLFITRREIVDAYCTWLFAFLLDVTRETLQTVPLETFSFKPRRLVAYFAERMLQVWLTRQRLRIKELNFMFVAGI